MPQKPEVTWVTHAELRTLVEHLSTLFAAQETRIAALEAASPVDPSVKAEAQEFVRANNGPMLVALP